MPFYFLSFLMGVRVAQGAMEGFVLEGTKTQIKYYPHSVYFNIYCTDSTYICGGSILNQRIMLTAAHCVEDCKGKNRLNVLIKYGHEYINSMKSTQMKDFIMHEHYDDDTMNNDIALVMGTRALPLGNVVKRVILMPSPPKLKLAYIAGWGVMNYRQDVSLTLLEAVQEVQPLSVCKKMGLRPRGTFCAGVVSGPGNPDSGDSGSALVGKNHVQIGLVSYKVSHYSLVMYTNVSYHFYWIRNNAQKLYCRHNLG
ncbi:mast cell protease 1A-like [Ostrinia nubilalis]|uniref:mast cell protease 1A-like n=1 Tax=Ostrinia nubilalis TaxID=29057 RepID=UPI0030822A8D